MSAGLMAMANAEKPSKKLCGMEQTNETACLKSELQRMRDSLRQRNSEWKRREGELNELFQRKVDALRQRWQLEKHKQIEQLSNQLRKQFQQQLETVAKSKDQELKSLRARLRKSEQQLFQRSNNKSGPHIGGSVEIAKQEPLVRSVVGLVEHHGQVPSSSSSQCQSEEMLPDLHKAKLQPVLREAHKHITALLEQLRQKDRRIEQLERQLRPEDIQLEHSLVEQLSSNETLREERCRVKELQMASKPNNNIASSNVKDEFDKERQRWQQKVFELSSSLKRSEEIGADLSQTKAELIRKIKDLEKIKKMLDENGRKLTDRLKLQCQESKRLADKLQETQEELLFSRQAYEGLTLECQRLKEKRYNPDRDEEAERLRQQNLEYCKCIAALKQTTLEKDRRIEVLQQKLRRSKRNRSSTNSGDRSDDETRWVKEGEFSNSSMSLDTITEDYAEDANSVSSSKTCRSESSSDSERDLRGRLQESLCRIVELEKTVALNSALGADSGWAQEKLKYASLVQSMNEKMKQLEKTQERLQRELQCTKEENELLEFQVLELENAQREEANVSSFCESAETSKSLCDRSVCTSDDEGHFSMDLTSNSSDEYPDKPLSMDDLRIRFTLLKHRRELRPDDRNVVAQVKEAWEALQNQHASCDSKLIKAEMSFREAENALKSDLERLQQQNLELMQNFKLKTKGKDLKELQRELETARTISTKMQTENELLTQEVQELQIRLKTCSKQYEDRRKTEIELLEEVSKKQLQNLTIMRSQISKLEDELDQFRDERDNQTNDSEQQRSENERLRKVNAEYQESLNEFRKLETIKTSQKQEIDRKYADLKTKFKESMKVIKEYELNTVRYLEQLKRLLKENQELRAINDQLSMQLQQIQSNGFNISNNEPMQRETTSTSNADTQLRSLLQEKTSELEEKLLSERRLLDERDKLNSKLHRVKSYAGQLESQFEMQIQIVQTLKNQLLELQKLLADKDQRLLGVTEELQQHRLLFRSMECCQNEETCAKADALGRHLDRAHNFLKLLFELQQLKCCQNDDEVGDDEIGGHNQRTTIEPEFLQSWKETLNILRSENLESCDINKQCVRLQLAGSIIGRYDYPTFFATTCNGMRRFCDYISVLRSKVKELEDAADYCHEDARKANARSQLLTKQYHDTVLALGQIHNKTIRQSTGETLDDDHVLSDLHRLLTVAKSDNYNSLCALRTRVLEMLGEVFDNTRTISPSEHCGSGTESELCERSPTFDRKRKTDSICSSTDSDKELLLDTCTAVVTPEKVQINSCPVTNRQVDRNDVRQTDSKQVLPPSCVRMAADLGNGRFLICWSQPEITTNLHGYKVYLRDKIQRDISDPSCTRTVIECDNVSDWKLISVRSIGDSDGYKLSAPAVINDGTSEHIVSLALINARETSDEECCEV